MTTELARPSTTPPPAPHRLAAGPAAIDRAGDGQHHRGRHLQPALRHRVVRADQPRSHGPRDSRRRSPGVDVRGALARIPAAGAYAYARAAFGNGFGFSQAWLYWITAWAGNAAIAVGWVFYVEQFLNKGGSTVGRSDRPGRALIPRR